MPQSLSNFLFLLVRNWDQAKILLEIRNQCRDGMTNHTDEISLDQQKVFFDKHLHPEYGDGLYRAYLLVEHNIPVGYGGLKWDGEKYWMTIGVINTHRGRGLSRRLTKLITQMAIKEGKQVWLNCWEDNFAFHGYLDCGYNIVSVDRMPDRVLVTMKYEGN